VVRSDTAFTIYPTVGRATHIILQEVVRNRSSFPPCHVRRLQGVVVQFACVLTQGICRLGCHSCPANLLRGRNWLLVHVLGRGLHSSVPVAVKLHLVHGRIVGSTGRLCATTCNTRTGQHWVSFIEARQLQNPSFGGDCSALRHVPR